MKNGTSSGVRKACSGQPPWPVIVWHASMHIASTSGPLLAVHLDRHEMVVHHRGDLGILERLPLHHVTPVAGRIADRYEQRTIELSRPADRLLAPRSPVHRVVPVLEQVGRRLARQEVRHAFTLPSPAVRNSLRANPPGRSACPHRQPITAQRAPAAVGPYVHAVSAAGLLFCSGQIGIDPRTGELVGVTAGEQAGRCLENLAAVCDAAGATLGDAVRVTVYLTDIAAFGEVNEVYAAFFETDPPARVAIGVAALPLGAKVEIEAVVAIPD